MTQTRQAGQLLEHGLQEVESTSSLLVRIGLLTQEQADGIRDVGAAVGRLDGVTRQNAGTVVRMAGASHSLQDEARRLRDAMDVFV